MIDERAWFQEHVGLAAVPQPQDHQRIVGTLYRYAAALDAGDIDEWVACFTADAHYSVWSRGADGPMYEVVGREALRRYRCSHPAIAPGVAWQHQVCNTEIFVEPGSTVAHSRSYWTSIVGDPNPRILAFGAYYDLLRRQADEGWLISTRVTESHTTQGHGNDEPQ